MRSFPRSEEHGRMTKRLVSRKPAAGKVAKKASHKKAVARSQAKKGATPRAVLRSAATKKGPLKNAAGKKPLAKAKPRNTVRPARSKEPIHVSLASSNEYSIGLGVTLQSM